MIGVLKKIVYKRLVRGRIDHECGRLRISSASRFAVPGRRFDRGSALLMIAISTAYLCWTRSGG